MRRLYSTTDHIPTFYNHIYTQHQSRSNHSLTFRNIIIVQQLKRSFQCIATWVLFLLDLTINLISNNNILTEVIAEILGMPQHRYEEDRWCNKHKQTDDKKGLKVIIVCNTFYCLFQVLFYQARHLEQFLIYNGGLSYSIRNSQTKAMNRSQVVLPVYPNLHISGVPQGSFVVPHTLSSCYKISLIHSSQQMLCFIYMTNICLKTRVSIIDILLTYTIYILDFTFYMDSCMEV